MKRFVCYLIAFSFLLASRAVLSQHTLSIQISKNYKNKPLVEILTELESQYEISFSYLDQVVQNKHITITMKNKALPEALRMILQGTNLSFQVFDSKNIVIFKKTTTETYSIQGRITDKDSGEGLPFANVIVPTLGTGDAADENGYYKIKGLASDTYEIRIQVIGYRVFSRKITLNNNIILNAELEVQAIELAAVEITPGIIQITTEQGAVNTLTAQEVISSPNFTKDVFRSVQVLPSVVSTDNSARPKIKGGNPDETAIFLDNMEILEPYHLYEVEGPGGIINTEIVENIKLMMGGFLAKYTDKMSGIIEIRTRDQELDRNMNVSIDFLYASLFLNKQINDKFSYFLSARRAYLAFVTIDDEFKKPTYYDVWSKLNYQVNPEHKLSANFLLSSDDLSYEEPFALIRPEYWNSLRRNIYGWLNWDWLIDHGLYSTATIGFQDLKKVSDFKFEATLSEDNVDNRHNDVLSVRQTTYWETSRRHFFEFGFEFKKFFSDYLFNEIRTNYYKTSEENIVVDSIFVDSNFDGHTLSGFVQDTWDVSKRLKFLLGLKVSTQSYTGGAQVAPRTSISYDLSSNLNLKLAYGWYYQPDNFQKLRSYQGQTRPDATVSKSIHYWAELNTNFGNRTNLKLDIYYKDYKSLQEDYVFEFFNRQDEGSIWDKPFNPVSAYSTGFETSVRHRFSNNNLLSLGYAYSQNKIKNEAGLVVPRDFDRRHIVTVNSILNLKHHITFSTLWRFHSGDPYTPAQLRTIGDRTYRGDTMIYFEFGEKNSLRLPAYHSLDMRLEKIWQFKKADLSFYVNIINLLDRNNLRSYEWNDDVQENGRVVSFSHKETYFFNRFVSLGLGISF